MRGIGRVREGLLVASVALVCTPAGATAAEGDLTFLGAAVNGSGGVTSMVAPNGVAVSPDGLNVYVANRFGHSVVVFTRNTGSGALTFLEAKVDGAGGGPSLLGARRLAISPDGKFVYVSASEDDAVTVFQRDQTTGALTFVQDIRDSSDPVLLGLDRALGLEVTPDGNFLYVAGEFDDAINVFSRDQTTGTITFQSKVTNTDPGVSGLDAAVGVGTTPDGDHLYATSYVGSSLTAWARNETTGALSFIEAKTDGVGGVDGLSGGDGPAISADGRSIYASGDVDDAVAAFSRDPSTGALTYVEQEKDGVNGVDGLNGATLLAISPDQKSLYAPGEFDNALAVFGRQATNPLIEFRQAFVQGVGGVTGMGGAEGVAVSPDGANVYVGSNGSNAVAIFARERDVTPPETQIDSGPAPGSTIADPTPTFAFSSPDPFLAGFECSTDGSPFGACVSGAALAALADGPHTFLVRARDSAGNADPSPAVRSFSIDTKPPDAQIKKAPKNKLRTRKKKAKARYVLAADDPSATLTCSLDGKPFKPCGQKATFKVKAKPRKGKKHSLAVRATDAAGNVDPTPATDKFRAVRR